MAVLQERKGMVGKEAGEGLSPCSDRVTSEYGSLVFTLEVSMSAVQFHMNMSREGYQLWAEALVLNLVP